MKAAIIANPLKDTGYENARLAALTLLGCGVEVLAPYDDVSALPAGVRGANDAEIYGGTDILVTLGGDGTILAAARSAAGRAPVLGINLGHKGFLTEAEPDKMEEALKRVAAGDFTIEKRLMLRAKVLDGEGRVQFTALALNDVYLTGITHKIVHVEARIDGSLASKYTADGMLVSSPTGSTGYALSAGGPVIAPDVQCMLLTPVCAHTFRATPVVVSASKTVQIRAVQPTIELKLIIDGEERAHISDGWSIDVARAESDALFVRLGYRDFYSLLGGKLAERND